MERMKRHGKMGENYDDVINRLIDLVEAMPDSEGV